VDYKNISTTNYQIPLQNEKNVARFDDIYDKLKLWCPITITHHKVHLSFMSNLEIIWRWICYYNRTMMRDQNILAWTSSWPCHCILCHYTIYKCSYDLSCNLVLCPFCLCTCILLTHNSLVMDDFQGHCQRLCHIQMLEAKNPIESL